MDADWDLQAVVRGCCSAVTSSSATATNATTTGTATVGPPDGCFQQKSTPSAGFFPDLFHPTSDNTIQQLMNNLYNYNRFRSQNLQPPPPVPQPPPPPPTPPAAPPQSHPVSAFSFFGGLQDPPLYNHNHHHRHQKQQQEKQFQIKQQSLGISRCTTAHAQSTTKIKKRKNQIKKVCQVPAEGSSPDLWSWRKYGQKPIKGSPYPRGYYKCSTLKGCSARKQVERNRSDPGMLIITYTGEHTHPVPTQLNSLSGTTRNKTTATTAGDDGDTANKPTPSSPISPATTVPPATEKMDETERDDTDDDNNFDFSGLVIDEDAFDGLDEIVGGSVVGDVFSDHHAAATTASPPLPWLSSNWPPQPPPLPAGVEF